MDHRIFVEWEAGAYLSSLDREFQAHLVEMVEQYGPPSKVEFRAHGEGWAPATPCEDCGLSYAKCRCDGYDPDAKREPGPLDALHDFYLERYGHLLDKPNPCRRCKMTTDVGHGGPCDTDDDGRTLAEHGTWSAIDSWNTGG